MTPTDDMYSLARKPHKFIVVQFHISKGCVVLYYGLQNFYLRLHIKIFK